MPRKLAPAKRANELIQRLVELSGGPALDEVSLSRIVRDAKTLMASDSVGARILLGGAAALRGDAEETRRQFRVALSTENTLVPLFNYSIALSLLEEQSEALEVTINALQKYPDDLHLLNHGIKIALESANFLSARDLSDRWDALAPDRPNRLSTVARQIAKAIDVEAFGEQGVRKIFRILAATQRGEGLRTESTSFSSYGDSDSFLYQRAIYAEPTLAASLNERLADQIAARSDLLADPGLKFVAVFTSVTPSGSHA